MGPDPEPDVDADNASPVAASSDLEALRREIDTTLAVVAADEVNLTYVLFRIWRRAKNEDRPTLLEHIAEAWGLRASSEEHSLQPVITKDEQSALKQKYGQVVDRMFDLVLDGRPSAHDCYAQLCRLVVNPILATEQAQVFALYWLLVDRRLPYHELDQGMRVSNDDWTALAKELTIEMSRVRFILATEFDQKSEKADLILRELDRVTGAQRVRLMAWVISELQGRADRLEALLRQQHAGV